MTYSAINIAKYMIAYCYRKGSPISNLKLQKMMYYLWIDYYKKTQTPLFIEDICAWQLGPVVPEVYYEFCSYAGTPILKEYDIRLSEIDDTIVREIIDRYIDVSASCLVSKTHRKGSPWDVIYRGGHGVRDIIPFTLIKDLECGNNVN